MRDIKNYEGLYAVTSCGKVWSYKRKKFLSPGLIRGYSIVELHKDGKAEMHLVHRLVAEAYLDNPDNLPQVNHKNEIRSNNFVNNLEWCTQEYNINYSHAKAVYCIELDKTFNSVKAAAQFMGLARTNLISCLKGRLKTFGGYHWRYI